MDIINHFKNKKNNSISKLNTSVSTNKRNKKPKNIVDFVYNGITFNGGDYNDIVEKLMAISEFCFNAKNYGGACNFSKIDEAINTFFKQQKHIKFYPIKRVPNSAFYTNSNDESAYYNYRGITIMQDNDSKQPIMYFGRRHKTSESHAKDTLLYFGKNEIVLQNELQANYDGIPLYGDGTYAEFHFDKDNKIHKLVYRTMAVPRLKIWGKFRTCEYDYSTGEYKLLPLPKVKEKHNDPVISDKSRKKLAEIILK